MPKVIQGTYARAGSSWFSVQSKQGAFASEAGERAGLKPIKSSDTSAKSKTRADHFKRVLGSCNLKLAEGWAGAVCWEAAK